MIDPKKPIAATLESRGRWFRNAGFVGPVRPSEPVDTVELCIPEDDERSRFLQLLGGATVLLALPLLAAAWQWTDLRDYLNLDTILAWASAIRSAPAAPLLVIGAYTLGGLVVFPVMILLVATALTFSPLTAFVYSFLGCMASAVTLYGLGRITGREMVRRFAGPGLNRLSRQLARRGVLTMITVRIFPIAPFTVVNFVAGASHIGFRDFTLGSAIGLAPVIFAFTVLGDRLGDSIRHPGWVNVALFVGVSILLAGLNVVVRRRLGNREEDGAVAREP